MEIHFDDLLLFRKCPVRYDMKTCGYHVSHKSYNDFLHDMYNYLVAAMFFHKENAIQLTESYWEDLYKKNQDIITEKKWLEGISYMCNIYDYITFAPNLKIIAINHPYLIDFPEHKVGITGNIPMIATEGNGSQYIIIDPSFSSKVKSDSDLEHDIKYTVYSKVIRDLYNATAIIINRNFKLNTESKPIMRNEVHYSRLGTITKNIALSIDKNLFVPKDDYSCNSCKLCRLCVYWGTDAFVNKYKTQTLAANEANAKRKNQREKARAKRDEKKN